MIHHTTTNGSSSSKPLMRRIVLGTITISLLLGGVKTYNLLSNLKSSSSSAAQTPTVNIPQIKTVTALGYLEPTDKVRELSSSSSLQGNQLEQLLVKEGDWVKTGQIIAIFDSQKSNQAALKKAQIEVKVAQAKLAQVKVGAKKGDINAQEARFQQTQVELEGQIVIQKATIANLEAQLQGEKSIQQATIARIKAELNNASTECERYQLLYQEGAVSASQRDSVCLEDKTTQERLKEARATLNQIINSRQEQIKKAKANLQRTIATAHRQIKEAEATLNAVSEVRPIDVQIAELELETAKAAVLSAQAELDLSYLRAPRDGQIIKIHTWPGESASDKGIVEIGQTDQMIAIAEVYESDISKVRVGQQAQITSTSITEELKGTVEYIGLQVQRQNEVNKDPSANIDAKVVEVKVKLDRESSQKVAGLTNLQVKVVIIL